MSNLKKGLLIFVSLILNTSLYGIRPTDGDGYNNNGYDEGIEVYSYDSPGGCCKVWYTIEGPDAVTSATPDGSVIPDFILKVGNSLDNAWNKYLEGGFSPPLDDSIYHDRPDFGGDGKLDCYIKEFAYSADGYIVSETYPEDTEAADMSGYLVIKNTFEDSWYPDEDYAIDVLTSHEMFHLIQNAYDINQGTWWTEGTAEWATEYVYPDHNEWLGFVPSYFDSTDTSLKKGGEMAESRAYGTVVWPIFLSEKFGPDIIREIWTGIIYQDGKSTDALKVTSTLLENEYDTNLETEFTDFVWWNFLTGSRAIPEKGYSDAASMPEVEIIYNMEEKKEQFVTLDPVSFAYISLDFINELPSVMEITVNEGAVDGISLIFVYKEEDKWEKSDLELSQDIEISLDGKSNFHIAAINSGLIRSQTLTISYAGINSENDQEVSDEDIMHDDVSNDNDAFSKENDKTSEGCSVTMI